MAAILFSEMATDAILRAPLSVFVGTLFGFVKKILQKFENGSENGLKNQLDHSDKKRQVF